MLWAKAAAYEPHTHDGPIGAVYACALLHAQRLGPARDARARWVYRQSKLLHCCGFNCDVLQAVTMSPIMGIIAGFIRMVFPIATAFYLIKFTFRLGATQKRDK